MTHNLEIICLESEAFWALMTEVVERVKPKTDEKPDWVDTATAMKVLKISSKTTLQKLRDTGAIRFSQPGKRTILYYYPSLIEYIERHARETF